MKAVFVIGEMPDCCGECEFCYPAIMNEHEEIYRCFLTGLDAPTTILDDCPLHPLPERKDVCFASAIIHEAQKQDKDPKFYNGWLHGWNACIDAITGGKDEKTRNDKEP